MAKRKSKALSLLLTAAMTVTTVAGMGVFAFADTTTVDSASGITDMAGNYVLSSDITVTAPIGSATVPFSGTIDGNGHTVTLNISSANGYQAFIANLTGTLEDVVLSGSVASSTAEDYVAAAVAYNSGTIKNVTNAAAVTANSAYNVGGIAGFNNEGTIESCHNTAAINANVKVGGVVGENAGTVKDCTNTADITSTYSGKNGIGGIVGRNGNNNTATETGVIQNCTNSGDVTCSNGKWAGGIAGFQNSLSSTTNCTNTGTISAYGNSGSIVGKDEGTTGTSTPITANYTINAGGTYVVSSDTTITVNTTDAVTLKGNGSSHIVTVNCTVAANLTIEDLTVSAPVSTTSNIINFTTGTNTLNISGTNLLENNNTSLNQAVVRVPAAATLNITGDGTLYLYKSSMGAGIGSDTLEASGVINFNHTGDIFLKGSKTGAVVGGDTAVGNIIVNSGNLNIIAKAKGAAIGGSAQCNGGNVTLGKNSNVKITCDFTGHAIGSGANGTSGGTLTINGGSLYVEKTSNSSLTDDNIINAAITNGTSAALDCLTLPVPTSEADGTFTVKAGTSRSLSDVYYGSVNKMEAVPSSSTTMGSWTTGTSSELYLYLPATYKVLKIVGTATTTYAINYTDGQWTCVA